VLDRLNVKFQGAIVTEQQWQRKTPRKLTLFRVAGGAIESSLDNDIVPPRRLPAKFVVVDTAPEWRVGTSTLLLRAHPDRASLESWLEQIEPTVADALRRSLVV